jgi:hypothetical protein
LIISSVFDRAGDFGVGDQWNKNSVKPGVLVGGRSSPREP